MVIFVFCKDCSVDSWRMNWRRGKHEGWWEINKGIGSGLGDWTVSPKTDFER